MVNTGADAQYNSLVALGNPSYTETSRRGAGYNVSLASGVAPLVAVPGTTAALEVFNNSATRIMVVRDIFAFRLLGTAVVNTWSMWAMVTTTKAAPTLTALTVYSTEGKSAITPTAASELVTGVGTTVVANGWRPYGAPVTTLTEEALPNNAQSWPIDGKIIIPKNCSFCMHAVGTRAAGTLTLGFSFDWVTATVEA
jgi:hypothetical protein